MKFPPTDWIPADKVRGKATTLSLLLPRRLHQIASNLLQLYPTLVQQSRKSNFSLSSPVTSLQEMTINSECFINSPPYKGTKTTTTQYLLAWIWWIIEKKRHAARSLQHAWFQRVPLICQSTPLNKSPTHCPREPTSNRGRILYWAAQPSTNRL